MAFGYFLIQTTERCVNRVSGTRRVTLTANNTRTSVRVSGYIHTLTHTQTQILDSLLNWMALLLSGGVC